VYVRGIVLSAVEQHLRAIVTRIRNIVETETEYLQIIVRIDSWTCEVVLCSGDKIARYILLAI